MELGQYKHRKMEQQWWTGKNRHMITNGHGQKITYRQTYRRPADKQTKENQLLTLPGE